MKLSTKGRYGVRLMLDLALHSTEKPVSLKDIAKRQGISEKYLWHLIPPLKNAGLIKSTRGARGGYRIAKKLSGISAGDILSVLEGPMCLVDCEKDASVCGRSDSCVAREMWHVVTENMMKTLAGFTLEKMVERQKRISKEPTYNI